MDCRLKIQGLLGSFEKPIFPEIPGLKIKITQIHEIPRFPGYTRSPHSCNSRVI